MAMITCNPFHNMRKAQRDMDRLWGDDTLFNALFAPYEERAVAQKSSNMSVSVDIREQSAQWVLSADLPGMKMEDISVEIDEGRLILSGERVLESKSNLSDDAKESKADKAHGGYHRVERAYGKFSRAFTLSENIDAENIRADYDQGVLTITLPKSEPTRPKKIAVKVITH